MFGAIRVGFSGSLSTVSTFVAEVTTAYSESIMTGQKQRFVAVLTSLVAAAGAQGAVRLARPGSWLPVRVCHPGMRRTVRCHNLRLECVGLMHCWSTVTHWCSQFRVPVASTTGNAQAMAWFTRALLLPCVVLFWHKACCACVLGCESVRSGQASCCMEQVAQCWQSVDPGLQLNQTIPPIIPKAVRSEPRQREIHAQPEKPALVL